MSRKRKKTIISEIKQIDRRKTQPEKNKSYFKFVQFWESQKSTLNMLIKKYPKGKEQWMTDIDEFIEIWNSCIESEIKSTNNKPVFNSLSLDDEESMVSYLPIFIQAKQSLDDFLETKNYSLEEKKILKNSYTIIYLQGLEDFFMKKPKSLKEEDKADFFMWLMSYYVFHKDCIFELRELEWLLEQASDLL